MSRECVSGVNATNNQAATGKVIDSAGEGDDSPSSENRSYKVFFFSPTDPSGNPIKDVSLRLSLDYINIGSTDKQDATLKLEAVNVLLYPPDSLP